MTIDENVSGLEVTLATKGVLTKEVYVEGNGCLW